MVGMFKNMVANIPGGNFLGRNFPGGSFRDTLNNSVEVVIFDQTELEAESDWTTFFWSVS